MLPSFQWILFLFRLQRLNWKISVWARVVSASRQQVVIVIHFYCRVKLKQQRQRDPVLSLNIHKKLEKQAIFLRSSLSTLFINFILLTFAVKQYFESMNMFLLVTCNPRETESTSHHSYTILTGTLLLKRCNMDHIIYSTRSGTVFKCSY